MRQKVLLILAFFAIVAGARAQTPVRYKSNVALRKNEVLESNVTWWKREGKLYISPQQLDASLQNLAQRPEEIKDIKHYVLRAYDQDDGTVVVDEYSLYWYEKNVGNLVNSFQGRFDLYKNRDGTPHHAVITRLEKGSFASNDAVHWIINEVTYEGLSYPVTHMSDHCCQNVFDNENVVGITMENLTTVGDYSFSNGAGGEMFFASLETLNMPNLTTVGYESFFHGEAYPNSEGFGSLKTLYLPNLETVGEESFCSAGMPLKTLYLPKLKSADTDAFAFSRHSSLDPHANIYLPIDVVSLDNCFSKDEGRITFHILDNGGKINNLKALNSNSIYSARLQRFLVPQGKAQALAELWSLRFNYEVYSPVPVSKANDGYGTMVIEPGDAWASYTQDGVTYVNHYDFNRALTAADVEKPFDGTAFNAPEDYRHKWFVATDYTDNNEQEGTLTITSPFEYGVRPGDGFLLQGPAFSGTGDGVMWVPVSCDYDVGIVHPYTDTNYFKAGTGAAVAKESDGCRNFYFSASMQGFYQCNNTVIPTNRAYLALPSEMTANAKQISFVIDDGESEVTGIVSLTPNLSPEGGYYSLDGRKLDGKPTTKGIYIHNGRKEVIK